jgi:hypothetical protein
MLKTTTNSYLALLLAFVLALPVFYAGSPGTQVSAAGEGATSPSDYFTSSYPSLQNDANHVFRTLTYHEFDHLLSIDGQYVVLFGGAWDSDTQAAIGYINEIAKEYGITAIHNFDPRLDGATSATDITDDANAPRTRRYIDLVNKYLTNLDSFVAGDRETLSYSYASGDSSTSGSAVKLGTPTLFVYNKNKISQDGTSTPIVSFLEDIEVLKTEGPDAYKAKIREVFDAISPAGDKNAEFSVLTNQVYVTESYNRHVPNDPIFEGENIVIEPVTLDELKYVLESEGTHAIVFGCAWCSNTRAIIKYVNEVAQQYGIDKVYNWDTKLDGGIGSVANSVYGYSAPDSGDLFQTRGNHPNNNLYVDLIKQYFPDLKAQYTLEGSNAISYTNAQGEVVKAQRLQAPYVAVYNKHNKDWEGKPQPILGHVELMYTWGGSTSSKANHVQEYQGVVYTGKRYRIYNDGLKRLFSRLESIPTGLAGVAPTTTANNNGQITGVHAALEYRPAGGTSFTAITGTTITGLAAGKYEVRYAAKNGVNGPTSSSNPTAHTLVPYPAGQSVEVTVPAGPAGSDGSSGYVPPSEPTPPPVNEETPPSQDEGKPSVVTLSVTTDEKTGTAIAVVSEEEAAALIEKAKKDATNGNITRVEFKAESSGTNGATQFTFTRSVFDKLIAAGNVEIKVNAQFGIIAFDAKALQNISANEDKGDISIIISKSALTEEGKEVLGDRPVYDLNVFAGQHAITHFGGSQVKVNIPYSLLPGEDAHSLIVYYVNEEGQLETIRGSYAAATRSVNFATAHFSQYIIGYNKVPFVDVSANAWFSDAIGFLAARGITNGVDESRFSPGDSVKRGQFIVLLLKAYGIQPDQTQHDNFSDAGDTYYTPYLAAAKNLGITTGVGNNNFAPESSITREDLFTLLYRALQVIGEAPVKPSNADLSDFTDANAVSGYAREAVEALVASGIVSGNDGKLNPGGNTTRAQVAQVLFNLLSE